MPTTYTSLLKLALPATGENDGTWGTIVNTQITDLVDSAIAGTTSLTVDADVTLTDASGTPSEARAAIIYWATASGTTTRNITAPARSKLYVVINAATDLQSIVFRGVGPTTGVTVNKGETCLVVWNGSDFVKIANKFADGTAAAPSIAQAINPDTGIYFPASGTLGISTEGSLRASINGSGTFALYNDYQEAYFTATTGSTYTIALSNGSIQELTLNANCTFSFPSPTAGKSFVIFLKQDAIGNRTATWPGIVRWPSSTPPTITTIPNRVDKYVFTAQGTYWLGATAAQNYVVT